MGAVYGLISFVPHLGVFIEVVFRLISPIAYDH